jgi:very-short-patch-repair endonuclease
MRHVLNTALVEEQHGVLSAAQLAEMGFDKQRVKRAIAAGHLHRVHKGVYAVGHRLVGPHGRWWAAILACGDGAVLALRSASHLWDLWPSSKEAVDVICPRQVRRPGIDAHRHRLRPDEVTVRDGLPVTTVERTLVDLARVLTPRQLEQAYDRARMRGLIDYAARRRILRRAPAPALQRLIDADRAPAVTSSVLEDAFLALIRDARLPEPDSNTYPSGTQVDFRWSARRLLVEVDGHGGHATRRARQRDARNDVRHLLHGWTTVRFTYEDVVHDPAYVLTTLRALLGIYNAA